MLRVMFDTNAYDKLVADSDAQALANALIADGKLTIIKTHIQEGQLAAIPDANKLAEVLSIPTEKVQTEGAVWDQSVWDDAKYGSDALNEMIERLTAGNPKHAADALIAVTTPAVADALVTHDKRLEKRIRAEGMQLPVWGFDDFVKAIRAI